MGLFDSFLDALSTSSKKAGSSDARAGQGLIPYGKQKNDGSHDHRTNKGEDRTPSQKKGDASKRK